MILAYLDLVLLSGCARPARLDAAISASTPVCPLDVHGLPDAALQGPAETVLRGVQGRCLRVMTRELRQADLIRTIGCWWPGMMLDESTLTQGDSVHSLTVVDAARLANAVSIALGLLPAYILPPYRDPGEDRDVPVQVLPNATGYRIPTATEWVWMTGIQYPKHQRWSSTVFCRRFAVDTAYGRSCADDMERADWFGGVAEWTWPGDRALLELHAGTRTMVWGGDHGHPDAPVYFIPAWVWERHAFYGVRFVRPCEPGRAD